MFKQLRKKKTLLKELTEIYGKELKKVKTFLKQADKPGTKQSRIMLIFLALVFCFLFFKVFTTLKFSVPVILLYGFLIWWNRENNSALERLVAFFGVFFVFCISMKFGHPILLVLFAILLMICLNRYHIREREHKIKLDSMVIISLTIVLLQVTYPLFQPKIDVLSVGEITWGHIISEKNYGLQKIAFSVVPPLLPAKCTKFSLAYDIKSLSVDDSRFNINIKKYDDGNYYVCTPFSDFTTRVGTVNMLSRQYLDYDIYDKNMTRFYWRKTDDNSTRIYEARVSNHEPFSMRISGNITFSVTEKTELDHDESLWDYLMNDSSKKHCRLNNFRLAYVREVKVGNNGTYEIEDDHIDLTFPINTHVDGFNRTNLYIQFDPYTCD